MSKFSDRLKEIRKTRNLTQKQVAEGIGISENQYQFYEYDKREPTISSFERLCTYFNVSADYLLGLSDNQERR
jgi:transcriptional regulator with XRE-family HTH domain